uniref:Uncharacterized protein n=1 Tax=Strongyloides venezuelensis TaxID=75913 RepID=A0A0K0FRN4_STRVS
MNKNKIKIVKDEKIYLEDALTNLRKMIEEKDEKIIELKKDVSMLRTEKDDSKENLNEINLADEFKYLDIEKPKLFSTPKKNLTKKENETFLNKSILDSFSNKISSIFPENNPSSHDIELILMLDKEKMISRYVVKKKFV